MGKNLSETSIHWYALKVFFNRVFWIAVIVYAAYRFVACRYFECPKYISGQYAATGFEVDDIRMFPGKDMV